MSRSSLSIFFDLQRVARVAIVLMVSGCFGCGPSVAGPIGADAWENPPPANLRECPVIDGSLIIAVPVAHRPKAIERLESAAIVELTEPEVTAVLDLPAGTTLSGMDLIKKEIEWLREQRRAELENQQGSWGPADQERLDRLTMAMSDHTASSLRPFLVRAVAKNEATGGFFGSVCGKNLVITHGSLGHSVPSSIRVPAIVFLQSKPVTVYVDWFMAQ